MSPDRGCSAALAVTEAITWALLLTGMFLKYVTETTELGVRVFGMVHGVAFVAYCVTTVVVAVDQRWSFRRALAGLACAVPPFATVPFDRYAESRGWLAASWRLSGAGARGSGRRRGRLAGAQPAARGPRPGWSRSRPSPAWRWWRGRPLSTCRT